MFISDRRDSESSKVRLEVWLPTAMLDEAAKRRKRRKKRDENGM
jgi:hypothetical protein